MRIKQGVLAVIILVLLFGTIAITSLLGVWNTKGPGMGGGGMGGGGGGGQGMHASASTPGLPLQVPGYSVSHTDRDV